MKAFGVAKRGALACAATANVVPKEAGMVKRFFEDFRVRWHLLDGGMVKYGGVSLSKSGGHKLDESLEKQRHLFGVRVVGNNLGVELPVTCKYRDFVP